MNRWDKLRAEVGRMRDDAYATAARRARTRYNPTAGMWDARGSALDEVLGLMIELEAEEGEAMSG